MPRHFFVICLWSLLRAQSQRTKMASATIPDRCRHLTPMAIGMILRKHRSGSGGPAHGRVGPLFFCADRNRAGESYCFGSVSRINSAR